MLLALCLPLLLQQSTPPVEEAAAPVPGITNPVHQRYLQWLEKASDAEALRLQLRASVRAVRDGREIELGAFSVDLSLARPARGTMTMQGQFRFGTKQVDLDTAIFGDGKQLWHLDHADHSYLAVPSLREIGIGLPGVEVVRRWSGLPATELTAVEEWQAPTDQAGWTGMRWLQRRATTDLRFDPDGVLRQIRVTPRGSPELIQIMEYEVLEVGLPKASTIAARALPSGYHPRRATPAQADNPNHTDDLLAVGSPLPDLDLIDSQGQTWNCPLGHTVVLLCVDPRTPRTLLALQSIQKGWQRGPDRDPRKVLHCVFPAGVGTGWTSAWQQAGLDLPILYARDRSSLRPLGIRFLPGAFVFDPDRRLRWRAASLEPRALLAAVGR